jgi:hypothetical protein
VKITYHHFHANAAVDGIHEHIEFICLFVNSRSFHGGHRAYQGSE